MLTGQNQVVRVGTPSAASTTIDSRPSRGELARARAAALEEELERPAVLDEASHVRVDDRGVEPVAGEAAADEERAGAAEDRPHREEVQVVAGGDEGLGQLVAIKDPREREVVH